MAIKNVNTLMTDSGLNSAYKGGSSNPAIAAISNANHSISNKALDIARAAQAGQPSPYAKTLSGGSGSSSASASAESYGGGGGGGWGFDYSSYLAQLQNLANEAYNRAKSSLDSTLSSTLSGLLESHNARKNALQGQYDSSKQTLDDDNAAALRAAYINKMINARDLNQLLTAQGLTGGQSETTTANMLNNYANNRNALNKTYNTNLRELLTSHNTSLADALAQYNDQVATARQNYANYLANLEQNRMNMIASAMPSFSNLLSMMG